MLRPGDEHISQWTWTSLVPVTVCCLVPSHYPNQFWLIIRTIRTSSLKLESKCKYVMHICKCLLTGGHFVQAPICWQFSLAIHVKWKYYIALFNAWTSNCYNIAQPQLHSCYVICNILVTLFQFRWEKIWNFYSISDQTSVECALELWVTSQLSTETSKEIVVEGPSLTHWAHGKWIDILKP